jgi:peptidoglycan/xylan/chitin deacetylase (PgdA/CDA1 family)
MFNRLIKFIANDKLSVFLFHKVPKERDKLVPCDIWQADFEKVVDYLSENFSILPLTDAVQHLDSNKLPKGSAAITFDDGYADWRSGVVPILESRSIPATFYISTGQLSGQPMWHERLANILMVYKGEELDMTEFRHPVLKTGTIQQRIEALRALEYHFKYLPLRIRDMFLDQLEQKVGAKPANVSRISVEDIAFISRKGFEIGAHTHDHPILGLCDSDLALDEIARPKEILQEIIKAPVSGFAYPNGHPGIDFSNRHIEMVKAAGYSYAVTTQWGVASHRTSPYQIPRFTPWGPSRSKMSLQLLRNLYSAPECLAEAS